MRPHEQGLSGGEVVFFSGTPARRGVPKLLAGQLVSALQLLTKGPKSVPTAPPYVPCAVPYLLTFLANYSGSPRLLSFNGASAAGKAGRGPADR